MSIKRDPQPEKILKSKNINIRVTAGEHERIKQAAKKNGQNITQWIEELIFGKAVK